MSLQAPVGLTSSATWLIQIQRLWTDRHPC